MIYDLIVAGSGSVGAAAGWYARLAGLNVLMIDASHPPHNNGSHHGKTRLVRHALYESISYVPLIQKARQLWDQLEQQSGERLMHRCGVINLGPASSDFMTNIARSATICAPDIQELTSSEIRQRWPQFTIPDDYSGLFEPQAGFLKSELAIKQYIRLTQAAGCALLFNCPITALGRRGDIEQVETPEGTFQARKLLITAGTWVNALLPSLPISPLRKVFTWYQADGRYSEANHFPAFTAKMSDGGLFYGFPAEDNALKACRHDGGQPVSDPEALSPFGSIATDGNEAFSFLRHILPGVGVCLHGETCSYDMSPDENFIIDTLPNNPRRLVISGLSGHGFKFASVLGEIAADFAQDKPVKWDISSFKLSRFR